MCKFRLPCDKKIMKPAISVILPVYNGLPYLIDSINSVLAQSFEDFELIIINDGSTDNSEMVVKKISDSRVRYEYQRNQGLAAALNKGVQLAKGKFIARLDQDDLMLNTRLAKQMEYLESQPNCAMVGTWSDIWVGTKPTDRGHRHATSHKALQLELLFDNPFVHSSVMMRTDASRELGGYSEDKSRQPPEDYDLWSRISHKYRVANIPEVLTVYREVEGSMSRTGDNPFLANVIQVSTENLAIILAPKFSASECNLLASSYHGRKPENKKNMITKCRTLSMHKQAALIIGGEFSKWSEEFTSSYHRQQAQIKSQFMRRLLPSILLKPGRIVKNLLKQSISYIPRG